ncbi:MAG TPA: uracil-DNA glycosylase family protein [Anaeromyxobacteraceae bacterium]|nr:uracil-DNA glycosylase family protein [Anaeromyxobacteraceae bacterium]
MATLRARAALEAVHRDIRALRLPGLVGPAVHGPPIVSRVFLLGQAPGPHEARLGRPFAWTAGKTLFAWMERAIGASEEEFREKVYMAAVVRNFPGKAKAGGDRVPSPAEIEASRGFIEREIEILRPRLLLPVGRLAVEQVLGKDVRLEAVVGRLVAANYHGIPMDVLCLPHPSGASTWYKTAPGRSLLEKALRLLGHHPEMRRLFGGRRLTAAGSPGRGPGPGRRSRARGRPPATGPRSAPRRTARGR